MQRSDIFRVISYSILTIAIVLLTILLLGPFSNEESAIGINDKLLHFSAFYIVTCMALGILQSIRKFDIFVLMLGYATLSELLQSYVGRDANFYDWCSDAIGITLAVLPLYSRGFHSKTSRAPERRSSPW
jgi:VanZ family protein